MIKLLLFRWIQEPSNWMMTEDEVPIICGNLTGARHCPADYTCLCVGPNPNHGYTNFDNFLWSMLTTFQLITLDYWENVYNMVSTIHIIFFILLLYKLYIIYDWSKIRLNQRDQQHWKGKKNLTSNLIPIRLLPGHCRLLYSSWKEVTERGRL